MARLHEHQGKTLLSRWGIQVPRGGPAHSPEQARDIAASLKAPCVVKVQAWTTGRAAAGGVAFATTADQAADHAARMLSMQFGNFPVTHVLVEEKLAIATELFVSLAIDEAQRTPVLLISSAGGSGVEDRAASAHRVPCSVAAGPQPGVLREAVAALRLPEAVRPGVEQAIRAVFEVARSNEARSVEINPLVITSDGRVVAADCRVTIDDYAVARHPELGIDIARELDHPPTALERIAYDIEQADHRGTFYFAQMNTTAKTGSKGLIGFHGGGGGGSMMSMDAITNEGFTIANFCDTSGNPSAAKVYRAARVILSQPGLIGYFGSGSGVANQEQFWSAYGLAKAFWELNLDIPAVIRLGGNTEDRAVEVLESVNGSVSARIEGYRKTDPPAKIAARFAALVADAGGRCWTPRPPRVPGFVRTPHTIHFDFKGGRVWIDLDAWGSHAAAIISRANGILRNDAGRPALSISADEFKAKDGDMIACEVECRRDGIGGVFVELDVPGLDAFTSAKAVR